MRWDTVSGLDERNDRPDGAKRGGWDELTWAMPSGVSLASAFCSHAGSPRRARDWVVMIPVKREGCEKSYGRETQVLAAINDELTCVCGVISEECSSFRIDSQELT